MRNLLTWNLLKRDRLLKRDPPAPARTRHDRERCEVLGLVSVDSDDHPWFTPRLFKSVADVTDDRLPGRHGKSMRCAPLFPCRFQRVAGR